MAPLQKNIRSRLIVAFAAAAVALPLLATPATAQGDPAPEPTPYQEPPGQPGLPASGTLATATSGTVTVSWTAPTGDAPVNYYRVMVKECKASKRADVDCKPVRGKTKNVRNATSVTFTKMKPGTTYNVWVRAINIWHKGPRLTGSVTTTAAPTFDDDSADWRIWSYTIGQTDQFSIGPLPAATGGHGTLTYSVVGVNSCNRGNVDEGEGDGCGSVHKYNKGGAPLVNVAAAGFSFDAATRTLTSNTGSNAPTAAKVLAATSGRATALPVTVPVWYTVTDADGITTRLTLRIEVQPALFASSTMTETVTVGTAATIQLPQAHDVAWSKHRLTGEVPGMAFGTPTTADRLNNRGGRLSGTPTTTGTTTLTWAVSLSNGASGTVTVTVNIVNGAGAPTAAPTSVSAEYSAGEVWIGYTGVEGATGYVVQVIPDGGSWPTLNVDHAPGSAHAASGGGLRVHLINEGPGFTVVSDIAAGTYTLRIAARNANGVGPWSTATFTVPE